ncbi:MAG: MotA/TolQ/ExbB proton channel family protein [Treponema sp.]|nr:MotA/TolQ/ExbB proton channel family protein [Treponema sp.]
MENNPFSLLDLFEMGGPIMWPLLVYSIVAVAIVIERIIYIAYHDLRIDDLNLKVSEYVKSSNYTRAIDYLSGITEKRMGARIFLEMMKQVKPAPDYSERRIERATETEAIKCVNSLENGFNFLVALGSLSPLTGFLGTVTGMIGAFRSIAEATEVNAQIVASGIYEALITTVFGLIVAIIAMVAHSILSHIIDRFSSGIENACTELIAEITTIQTTGAKTVGSQAAGNQAPIQTTGSQTAENKDTAYQAPVKHISSHRASENNTQPNETFSD